MRQVLSLLREYVTNQRAILAKLDNLQGSVSATRREVLIIGRKVGKIVSQSEEVRSLVESLAASQAEQDRAITDVAGDVAYLKDKLDQLPTGEPIDAETMQALRDRAASAATTASALAQLAAETDSTGGTAPQDPNGF